jgi:hypothetical protein
MNMDCYTLEVMAKTKLAELRAEAARHALVALSRGQVLQSRMGGPEPAPAQSRRAGRDAGLQDLTPLIRR